MADKRVSIVFDASMEVGKMKAAIDSINKSLQQTSVNIPKHTTQTLTKLISSIQGDMTKLEGMTNANLSPKNSKEILKIQDALVKNFKNLKTLMGNMGQDFKVDPSTFFPDNITDKIEKATKALREYQQTLAKGPQSEGFSKVSEELKQAQKQQREYEAKARAQSDNKEIAIAAKAELKQQKALQEQIKATADEEKRQAEKRIEQAQAQQRTEKQLEKIRSKKAEAERRRSEAQATADKNAAVMATKTRTDTKIYSELSASKQKAEAKVAAESTLIAQYNAEIAAAEQAADRIAAAEQEKIAAIQKSAAAQKESSALSKKINAQSDKIGEASGKFTQFNKQAEEAAKSVAELTKKQEEMQAGFESSSLQGLIAELQKLGITPIEQSLDGVKEAISNLSEDAIKEVRKALEDAGVSAEDLENQLGGIGRKSREFAELTEAEQRAKQEMDSFKRSVMDFFSITNSIYLFKRAIQSAFETVKELDAVMTETAVVTDFTVGDMWEKLPEYADQASALGASIKDLYGATTLYYQQGLNSEQAMSIGIETIKMARIANMEAADATQAMTAALRGFNMEINETNATRINDVYSELAAITAADTNQIATAMTKTASIASSANMEFETTAALLAQIIETTQEAPETAGTAMKTIIARFTEVKKLFNEGMLSGEDSEGEAIEINKIDAALRTVGISLTDFLKGQKGIDDIFLELASKWDTLDLATQRYIATTAAGSRQQSRFIAMMSNYDRTMELVNAANNSAGASQEQFEKTLDSMQAKLQKLTDAWNEFTMGLANNEILKGGIDMLTWLLETINKLTDALSGGSGLSKSFLNLTTVVGALAGGKGLLEKVLGWAGGAMGIEQRRASPKEQTRWQRSKEYAADQTMGGFRGRVAGIFGKRELLKRDVKDIAKDLKVKADEETARAKSLQQDAERYGPNGVIAGMSDPIKYEELTKQAAAAEASAASINNLSNEIVNNGQITQEQATQIQGFGVNMQQAGQSAQAYSVDLQAVGAAAMLVGGAFGLLANVFENNGMDEAANTCRILSTAATGLASVFMILPALFGGTTLALDGTTIGVLAADGAFKSLGVTIGTVFMWVGVALVAVIALVAAFKAVYAASPEGKLEAATEAANDAAEAAENAAQAYENLASALDSINGKSAAIENLAVGTTEWKNAVQELNGEVLDLVEQYPELAKFVDTSKRYLSFKTVGGKTVDDVLETYQDNKFKAQSASAAAKLQKLQAQQNVDFRYVKGKITTQREQTPQETANQNSQRGTYGLVPIATTPSYAAVSQGSITEVDREATDEIARAIAKGEHIKYIEKDGTFKEGSDFAYLESVYSEAFASLKKHGEDLLAADAATKVFTDSLLSNALMISDVYEDQKSNMMNFLSSEQIDNLVKNKKEDIKKDGISNEEKIKYAETMGYEYINGKFYTGKGADQKEVVVSDDSIAAQLAGIYTTEDLKGKMEALNGVLTKITNTSDPLYQAFEAMTEKGEGAALTTQDLEKAQNALNNISKEEIDLAEAALKKDEDYRSQTEKEAIEKMQNSELYKMYTDLGLDKIYGSFSEFFNFVNDSAILASERQAKASEKLETIDQSGFIQSEWGLDVGQISGIADLLYESVLKSGKGILESGNFIDLLSKGLSGTDGTKLAEALSMIDITNIDSIEGLSDILKELGYAGELTSEQIALLEQQIIQATKATKKFEMESLKKEIKSMQDLIDDISERKDTDRTFTEEEYGVMTKADPNLKSDFVMTGIDEYVYVGDSMNNLINALNQNTAALLGKTGEQIKAAALESEKWGALTAEGATDTQIEQYELLKGIAEGSVKITKENYQAIVDAMYAVGLVTNDLVLDPNGPLGQDTAALIASRIMNGWAQYGSAAAQTENAAAWQNWQTNMPQVYYSSLTGQQILTNDTYVDPNTGQPISDQQDQAARTGALDAKLVQQEGGTAEYEYMVENNEAWKEHGNLVKAAIIDSAEYEKKIAKLADTISENADALQDSKKGTREYQRALGKVVKAAKEAFGDDITKDFVEDNLDLFKDFAKGSTEALDKIRDKIADQIVDSLKKANKYTNKELGFIEDAINGLDGLDFDIYGHADGSEIFTMLAAVLGSAEAAAAAMERMGYDVTWEPAGQTALTLPDGSQVMATNYRAVVTDVAGNAVSDRSGGGGGGGGGSKWENPYDKLYNLQEKINQDIREREQLERRYNRLIDRRLATAAELQRISQAEIDSLREQAKLQQQMVEGRQEMMQEEMEENAELQKYATIDINSGEITIDWELIDKVKDEEEGSEIEEYISKLEELRDSMHEAQDALEDIDDAIWEIEERGREEYLEFEDRIKEALTEVRQKEIDTLEEINDSINDTNDKLLDSIQQSIDKMRQDRENEKTEEDLQEKQRRLAYLEQDTSNANAMEILELRKEIEEGQEDYTDTLIDQKISELQEQNDKAAEQREKQITLLQNQLDWEIESGRIWQVVEALMQDGLDPQGGLIRGSILEQILKDGEQWTGLSDIGQMNWLLDLETLVAESMNWRMTKGQLENLHEKKTGQEIEFINSKGEKLTGTVDEKGQVWTGDDIYYKDVYQWIDGNYYTSEKESTKYVAPKPKKTTTITDPPPGSNPPGVHTWEIYTPGGLYITTYTGTEAQKEATFPKNSGSSGYRSVKKYKTGGLADFTGPAWLDGTKSRPELVLNQRDTQNFIHLKDILSSIMSRNFSNTSTATENNGDITYDIDINVETMGSDYDVEQVANKVKSMINEDARYRNNNAISLKR